MGKARSPSLQCVACSTLEAFVTVFRCDPRSPTFSPLRSNPWVHHVVPRVLATRNPSTFCAPGRGLWCVFFHICFNMADANARPERLRRRNAARGDTEPIFRRHEASAGEEEEEDLESSYLPSGRTEPSLFSRSFWESAVSCAGSRHGAGAAALSTHR
jgi:hypothetical protein